VSSLLTLSLFFNSCGEKQAKPHQQQNNNRAEKKIEVPSWFGNLKAKEFEIIGYGSGNSLELAKEMARNDIVNQISVQVKNELKQNKLSENGNFSSSFQVKSIQKSDLILSDLEIIKTSKDKKFVALKYNNLPFEKKFLNELKTWKCSNNRFFKNTKVGKLAIKKRGCIPDFKIFRNQNSIFLNAENSSKLLKINELFFSLKNAGINLEVPQEIKNGDKFDIKFRASKSGFVSILVASEDGDVFEIISNYNIQKNRTYSAIEITQQHFYGKIENGKEVEENMFFAIFSEEPLNSKFLKIRSEEEQINGFGFDKLIEIFNLENIEFTTKIQYLRI
jgi:hypothetical protein